MPRFEDLTTSRRPRLTYFCRCGADIERARRTPIYCSGRCRQDADNLRRQARRASDPDFAQKRRDAAREWGRNNPERKAENRRRSALNNPDKVRASREKWKREHPEEYRSAMLRDAYPAFTVRGPAPAGFTITNIETGQRIVSTTVIPAGSALTITTANGTAYLDGADRSGQLTVREWTPVPPGGERTFQFSAPTHTAAALVASVRDTHW